MARFYADENVPTGLVSQLRDLGHDVLTAFEDGRANQGIDDPLVLRRATDLGRCVLNNNRHHFHNLHREAAAHAGIITFSADPDLAALAIRIHDRATTVGELAGQLFRVVRPSC